MKESRGKKEVWDHACECGIDEGIRQIAKYFDIKDVSIVGNGRLTYMEERPRRMKRIAVAAQVDVKSFMEEFRRTHCGKK